MAIKVANNNQALSFKVAGPQLPDSIVGLTFRGTLTSADDLNDLIGSAYAGYYYITSSVPANAPNNASTYSYILIIANENSQFTQQIYINPGSEGYYANNIMAIRKYVGSPPRWVSWYNVQDIWANRPMNTIESNIDLNDVRAPGVYICSTTAVTQSLANSPYTEGIWIGNSGFRLENVTTTASNYFIQRIVTHNVEPRLFIRTCSNGTFQAWTEIHKNNIVRVNYKTETIAAATATSLAIDSSEVLKGFNPLTNATAGNRYITVPAGTYRFSYQINTNPGTNGHARAWLSWSNTSSTPSTTASYAVSVASGGYANNNFLGLNGTGVLKFTEASRVALVFLPYNNGADVSGPGTKPYMIIERL